jgi:hypothetical protein
MGLLAVVLLCAGCGDDDGAAGQGAAGDGPDALAGPDDSSDVPEPPGGETGATETNVMGAPCEGDDECPMSFCGDPAPDGSRVCAPPGLILPTDEDAGI